MTSQLIRKEVSSAQAEKSLGPVQIATPISFQIWAASAAASILCLLVLLLLGHYTRREHVTGTLVPQEGLLTLRAQASGNVSKLWVHEGSTVHEGDTLLSISDDRGSVALGDTATNISAQIRNQIASVSADLSNTESLAEQEAEDLRLQRHMLQEQARELDAQIGIQRRETVAQADLLVRLRPLLAKGYVSVLVVSERQSAMSSSELQLKSLSRARLELEQQLVNTADSLSKLPLTTALKVSELKSQLSELEERLLSNEANRDTALRAPRDGVVSTVLVAPGQAVLAAQPVASIVPSNSPLQAQLLVPTRAIGFVHIGTSVALRYTAFPYQKFGVQRGTVSGISKSTLNSAEAADLLGSRVPEEPFYRVRVNLDHQAVNAYGKQQPLMPGMSVQASLLLDKRRLIEWVFEPLYGMKN